MLIIKPIQSNELQAEFCQKCGIEFHEKALAYAAHVDGVFTGICQFTLNDEFGLIENLASPEDIDDFEALFIMGRQTMNFIDLCGVHKAEMLATAASERNILSLGFKKEEDGCYRIDMTGFFEGGSCQSKH